jgi:hypothetical protein
MVWTSQYVSSSDNKKLTKLWIYSELLNETFVEFCFTKHCYVTNHSYTTK